MKIHRAVILAAGRGSRMGNETEDKPKCLTQLGGKALLDWQLQALEKAGVSDITLIRGYKKELLTGNYATVDNFNWATTNMVSSFFCLPRNPIDLIVSYSDIVYNHAHIETLMASDYDITITADKKWLELWSLRFKNPLDDAETFKSNNDKLVEIGNSTDNFADIEAQYMGLMKITTTGWDALFELYSSFSDKKRHSMHMTGLLNEALARGIEVGIAFIEGGWCEADTYDDILTYEKELDKTNKWIHDWR